jgi:hypothetical protein
MPLRQVSQELAQRVRAAARTQAQALGCDDAEAALAKRPDALLEGVAAQTGATIAVVREVLIADAEAAFERARAAMETLQRGASVDGGKPADLHTPLQGDDGARPMGLRLTTPPPVATSAVKQLQEIDLSFDVDDIARTRIAISSEARPAAIAQVVAEGKKLLKLVGELAAADPESDTRQTMADIQRIYRGLSSAAANNKGVFLTKDDASVALGAALAPPGAAGDDGPPGFEPGGAGISAVATRAAKKLATAMVVGVDAATGEKVILQPKGRIIEDLPLHRFVALHDERQKRNAAAKIVATDAAGIAALRSYSDADLDKAKLRDAGKPVEYVTLQGDHDEDRAFTYPTRWVKDGNAIFSRRMIVEGPFRGIFLDDLVSHLDEKSRDDALVESRLTWLKPTQAGIAPMLSTVEVKQGKETKKLLRIRVPSTREWTAVRQSLQLLADKLEGDVKLIPGSKNTLFVFEPENHSFVRMVTKSFGSTPEAQALVDAHVAELRRYEAARTPEALEKYSAANIGGFRARFIGRDGRSHGFELSTKQRESIAQIVMDDFRGAITLGMGMGKTLVAIAAMQLLSNDEKEKRPFLVVVQEGGEGTFHAEIFNKMSQSAGKALADRLVVMNQTEFRKAMRSGTHGGEKFDASRFAAVTYDEAHTFSNRQTATARAVLSFKHPRTLVLTGTPKSQPEEAETLLAASKAIDLNAPEARLIRKKARKRRRLLFNEVNGIAVEVKEPFELKRGLKIDPARPVREHIRVNFIYGDAFDDDVSLPKRIPVHVPMTMPEPLEKSYRAAAKGAKVALEGYVSIFRDGGLQVRSDGNPVLVTDKRGRERTRRAPQAWNEKVHRIRTELKKDIAALSAIVNTPERVRETGKRLLAMMAEDEIASRPLSRAIAFTDDKDYVSAAAKAFSEQMPAKLHAAALGDKIVVYQNGKALDHLGPFKVPFTEQAYRMDPTKPAHPQTNPEIPAEGWRTFVLGLLGQHPEVATTSVYGPVYQAGHNLQWANTVIHLDRDTWSDFNMRQRDARVLRRGQTRPVTVMYVDYAFAKPRSMLDRTLDEVRKLQAENDARLHAGTFVAAQKIRLGEDYDPARDDDLYDQDIDPDYEAALADMALIAAGAEPTAELLGAASAP